MLLGSLISAVLASVVLRTREQVYRRLAAEETVDHDRDGIPDAFQRSDVDGSGRG